LKKHPATRVCGVFLRLGLAMRKVCKTGNLGVKNCRGVTD